MKRLAVASWVLALVGISVAGCIVQLPMSAEERAARTKFQSNSDIIFAGSETPFVPRNASERAVLDVMMNRWRAGLERYDLEAVRSVLSANFEQRFLSDEQSMFMDTREQFIALRKDWVPSGQPVRRIVYKVQDIISRDGGKTMDVIALSTWKTKYFEPRFLESLQFVRSVFHTANEWRLRRQAFAPLQPTDTHTPAPDLGDHRRRPWRERRLYQEVR